MPTLASYPNLSFTYTITKVWVQGYIYISAKVLITMLSSFRFTFEANF